LHESSSWQSLEGRARAAGDKAAFEVVGLFEVVELFEVVVVFVALFEVDGLQLLLLADCCQLR